MRKITETHTGKIVSDTDLCLEYLFVGDYGKENNIVIDCEFAGADYFTKEGSCCVRLISPENENNPAEWQILVLELGL